MANLLPSNLSPFYSGRELFGEELSDADVAAWLTDESHGYGDLAHADSGSGAAYPYHSENEFFFWRNFSLSGLDVVGIGSAHGAEFLPVVDQLNSLRIVEPDVRYHHSNVLPVEAQYSVPGFPGLKTDLGSESADAIVCFGVLHHLPRVSDSIAEFARLLRPRGLLLLKEPTVSMGDWNVDRPGLTTHERGIPIRLLREMLVKADFRIVRESPYSFAPLDLVPSKILSGRLRTRVDASFAKLFRRQQRYYRSRAVHRLGARSVAIVARRN